MSPEEALEQMMQREKQMAKEAAKMIERVRRLQDISYCVESNHQWVVDTVEGATHTQVDSLRIACTHCEVFFLVERTNEHNAVISPLNIEHEGKVRRLQDFLDNKEEEE